MRGLFSVFLAFTFLCGFGCSKTEDDEKKSLNRFRTESGKIRLKNHSFAITGDDENSKLDITKLDKGIISVLEIQRIVGEDFYFPHVPATNEVAIRVFQTTCKSMEDLYNDEVVKAPQDGYVVDNFDFYFLSASYLQFKKTKTAQTKLIFIMTENKVTETCPVLEVTVPVDTVNTAYLGDLRATIRMILKTMRPTS